MMKRNYTPLGVQPGDKFGRLTVIRDSGQRRKSKGIVWECRCDCGNSSKVITGMLRNGTTKSCGCLRSEKARAGAKKLQGKRLLYSRTDAGLLNQKRSSNNRSGIKGVSYCSQTGNWRAGIFFQGTLHYLGRYPTKEAAAQARRDAELKYFAPVLQEHGMNLKPQEIDQDMMKDDTYKRRPFYDFGKGVNE